MSSGGWIITWIQTILCLETPLLQVSLDTPTSGISSLNWWKYNIPKLWSYSSATISLEYVVIRCGTNNLDTGDSEKIADGLFCIALAPSKKRTNHLKIVINGILPHDDYSFELHQERVCGQVPHPLLLLPSLSLIHTFWHTAWQVSITHFWWLPGLPLSYPTVSHLSTHSFLMRLKWINDHQASYVR